MKLYTISGKCPEHTINNTKGTPVDPDEYLKPKMHLYVLILAMN